jgi:glutamate mutase epsilon subunit
MIVSLTLLFSGAALLASAVYATTRLNRQASAAFGLARSLERHAGRREMNGLSEAPDGWPYAL